MAYRWLVTEYAQAWENGTLTIVAVTDVPVHLFLRWTPRPTWMHPRAETIRGVNWLKDPKYCFVAWTEVDQVEAGDTLIHTFSFSGWAEGEERCWHFRGELDGVPTTSNTGLWCDKYLAWEAVFSLGILGEDPPLVGDVKLQAGSGISLIIDPANTRIIIGEA